MKYTKSPFCAILKCRCIHRLAGLYFGSLDLLYGNIIVIHPSDVILYLFQLLTTWNGVVRKRKYLRNIGYASKKMAASLVGRMGRALKELENIIALAFGKQFPPRK